jgi:hypothetical protein
MRKLVFSVLKNRDEQNRVGEGIPDEDPNTTIRELDI